MKKYIKPSIDVVEMEAVSILAGSAKEVSNSLSDETPDDVTFHSASYSVWGASGDED